jgi:Bacterial sugar transferase
MDYRPIGMLDARPSWATPVMLVASSEGHLLQLVQIRDQWPRSAHVWVTFNEPDARSLLKAVVALNAMLFKLDSRGAAFFRQVRMGCGDRTLPICKLRTMTADATVARGGAG